MAPSKLPRLLIGSLALALVAGSVGHANERPARIDRPGLPAAVPNAAGTTAQYYGGPVTENAKVYVVWWGDPSKINPAVTAAKGGIADFFTGILDSSYMDFMNEYNTTGNATAGSHSGMAGTGQRIGRGNYAGTITLTNIPSGNVTDAQIQSTIDQALTAGVLPPPDDNTLYALYFPTGLTINLDGDQSCAGFGAYHEAIMETQRHAVYYLVMPDCGGSFNSVTSVTSHELVEAITDNQPTAGSTPDYPQAWNDTMGNEMGDLCESAGSAAVTTGLGSFTVQNIWDERTQSCKVFSSDANDFNVSISPNVVTVDLGAPKTFTVKTAVAAGSAQMLTLSATAPTGVTATVSPTTITAGATASLTVTATNPSAQSGLQVVVRADATSGSTVQTHTAALLISTSSTPADLGPPAADLGGEPADMAQGPGVGDGAGDDMGTGTGGNGLTPSMPKGCGCVIGGAGNASALDGTWPEAALLLAAFALLAARRRRGRALTGCDSSES